MSVGQDLVGQKFQVGQYSLGDVADPSANPLVYTETTADPGSAFGAGPVTVKTVTTAANGVTTITGTVTTDFGSQNVTGIVLGNDANDILLDATVAGASGDVLFTNTVAGQPGVGNSIDVSPESAGVVYQPVCFASGTRLRTPRGDVAVEALAAGDLVLTSSGVARPVRWIGHRTLGCAAEPCPQEARPVRIAAHAFGPSRPARDLVVSPGHAICVDVMGEALVPAAALINGTTVAQEVVATVTYWHVELDSHDILLAENLPAESYLEMGNRRFFADGGVVALRALPDVRVATHADFCRPYAAGGAIVDAVRAQLAARAGAQDDRSAAHPDARAA